MFSVPFCCGTDHRLRLLNRPVTCPRRNHAWLEAADKPSSECSSVSHVSQAPLSPTSGTSYQRKITIGILYQHKTELNPFLFFMETRVRAIGTPAGGLFTILTQWRIQSRANYQEIVCNFGGNGDVGPRTPVRLVGEVKRYLCGIVEPSDNIGFCRQNNRQKVHAESVWRSRVWKATQLGSGPLSAAQSACSCSAHVLWTDDTVYTGVVSASRSDWPFSLRALQPSEIVVGQTAEGSVYRGRRRWRLRCCGGSDAWRWEGSSGQGEKSVRHPEVPDEKGSLLLPWLKSPLLCQ